MVPVAGCRDIPAWLSCSWPTVGRLCLGELSVSPWVPIPGVCVGKPLPHGGAWASHSAIKEVKLWLALASCSSVSESEGTGYKVSFQPSGLQGVLSCRKVMMERHPWSFRDQMPGWESECGSCRDPSQPAPI